MFQKAQLYLRPLLIGLGGLILVFMTLMMAPPFITIAVTAILFFLLGLWMGKLQPTSLWYAPLLLNVPLWIVFFPRGRDASLPLSVILFFMVPPIVALLCAYLGMFIGRYTLSDKTEKRSVQKSEVGIINKYFLPLGLGMIGMFLCLFSMFLGSTTGANFPFYVVAYPVIFSIIGTLLSLNNPYWLNTAIMLCLIPVLYWVVYQPISQGINFRTFSFNDMSTTMFVIMPLTLLLTATAGFLVVKLKKGFLLKSRGPA